MSQHHDSTTPVYGALHFADETFQPAQPRDGTSQWAECLLDYRVVRDLLATPRTAEDDIDEMRLIEIE